MEQGVPECYRNKLHQRLPPHSPPGSCVGARAAPSRPYSPPHATSYSAPCAPRSYAAPAPTGPPAPCTQQPRTPTPVSPPASPHDYRNYPTSVPSSPTRPPVEPPDMQLAPMQFSNMLEEPTESCVIIEEEIERVEPVDFPENMQNVKKEVKLVRPYGVVIQCIEEVIEELPRGAERPAMLQRTRRKITRRGGSAGGAARRLPGAPWDDETPALPWDADDPAAAAAADPNAVWCAAQY